MHANFYQSLNSNVGTPHDWTPGRDIESRDAVLVISARGQDTSRDQTRVEDRFPGMAPSFMPPTDNQH